MTVKASTAAKIKVTEEEAKARAAKAKAKTDAKPAAKTETKPAAKTEAKPAAKELPTPTEFTVRVLNDGKELYTRTVSWGKKLTCMKGTRQKIRDWGTTIRNAEVTDTADGGKKTIKFTGLTISEKPKTRTTTTSGARKNAEEPVHNETDTEIIGIASDQDATSDAIVEALKAYSRHQLIHAFNVLHPDDKLTHYTKKADAVAALANAKV